MSILLNRSSKVVVQGMTGSEGTFHTQQMLEFGTRVVAGVSPGKGGTEHLSLPVFDTVQEAVDRTAADVAAVFVPPAFAADAIMEASAAGVPLVVCITELIPVNDMVPKPCVEVNITLLLGSSKKPKELNIVEC